MSRLTSYRQLPAWSPISARALAVAAASSARGQDAGAALARLLIDRYEADGARLVGSGTHALQLALTRGPHGPDGVALLPAYTCYEVATAALGAGRRVALYDLDADTLAPDVDSVRRAAAGLRVSHFVVAPLYGMPIDWSRMRALADELGAWLVADAAQAQGARYAGRPVAAQGDAAVLSFGRGKGWTGGGGGALLWRGSASSLAPDDGARVGAGGAAAGAKRALVATGVWLLARPRLYGVPASIPALGLGETIFHDPSPVRGMSRFSAALVMQTDEPSRREAEIRRRNAAEYTSQLAEAEDVDAIGARGGSDAGALRYPIRMRGGWNRARSLGLDRLGAGPPYPTTLARLPALVPSLVNAAATHPVAQRLTEELITVPTHSRTIASERRELCALLQ